ncbi:Ig-like domain-containing protein [Oceanispirochaeta crateris]|nr:Ig-like domain-containing protein [Oceanispirochaeta crateris]
MLCLPFFTNCRFMEEFRHMDTPVVEAWFPGEGFQDGTQVQEVSLIFSTKMDRNLSEKAFSLTEDALEIQGFFTWDEKKMRFRPYLGFQENKSYRLNLQDTAEDRYGNSLPHEWSANFFTGEDQDPPFFISAFPTDSSNITDLRQEFTLEFSEPLDQQSFIEAFSISPNLKFYLQWMDTSVIFHPLEDFKPGEIYDMTISKSLMDPWGNPMDRDVNLSYKVPVREDPVLEYLLLTSSGTPLLPGEIHPGVEKDDEITGHMDKPLNEEERLNFINLLPDSPYNVTWDSNCQDFTLRFESLHWEYDYEMTIMDEKFLLLVNGEKSRPPEVLSLSFCADSATGNPQILSLNSALGAIDSSTAFLDFLFSRSPAGEISQFAFMDAFGIDSSVVSFVPTEYELYHGTLNPEPVRIPASNESLIRIHLDIVDSGLPGVITFSLSESLTDTLGNPLVDPWTMTVNQP